MKIGILTFHRCINYGSFWQTVCLVNGLQALGHEVLVLDHYSQRVNLAEWKCALQPVLPTPVPASDYPLYKYKIRKFFNAFNHLPLSRPFPLEHSSQMEEFDLVIVGSDEVWNLSHPWYGHYPVFYGDGIRAKRLISYAASFGNYDVSRNLSHEWANRLLQFEKISVRDENSQSIVRNAVGIKADMVLDPCLQFPVQLKNENLPVAKPYVAVYGHNFSAYFAGRLRRWARARSLPLISIGYRNDWTDEQWITADPYEFAAFINGAKAVITNFFHGCVFALVNSRPFVCETSSYRNHKIQDLMKKVGGEKHLITENIPAVVYDTCLTELPHETIYMNITALRKASQTWLIEALENRAPVKYAISSTRNDHR